jgi:nucleotide-binding universal stress UspA family protein
VSAIAERLERLTAGATDVDCGATWLVETGHPTDCLVAVAREIDGAMIVVGSTGPLSSLPGSISADLTRRAPCPVVVVPPGAEARVNGHSHAPDDHAVVGRSGTSY